MELYDINLPDPKPENAEIILQTCRDIHQQEIDRHHRNTKMRQWDKYWVAAYNAVLERLSCEV